MRRFSASSAIRASCISVAYLIVWIGLDLLARGYGWHVAVIPWYPGVAVLFYLLYTFGWRYLFLPLVAELLRAWLFPATNHGPILNYVEFGFIQAVGYAIVAAIMRERVRVNLPLVGFRDASNFCASMMIASAAVGLPVVGWACIVGRIPWVDFWNQTITYWIGDGVALVCFVPALAMYLTPLVAPWQVSPNAHDDYVPTTIGNRVALVAAVVASIFVGYATVMLNVTADPILYFTFLPLVLIASRGGLRFVVPVIVLAELLTTALNYLLPSHQMAPLELQSYLAISALSALAVGALVTQHHRQERRSRMLAYSDPLTRLPNRASLEGWLKESVMPLTLALFDIDRKKLTTSGLSRRAVDEVMIEIAGRLQTLDAEFVARVESDEFACAFAGSLPDAQIAKTLFATFDEPFQAGESEIFIPISMGISHTAVAGDSGQTLQQAGLAMYRSKRSGRGGYTVFTSAIAASAEDSSLISELHRAYRDREFLLFYQPIIRLHAGAATCVGAEALLRWEHPTLGLLEPGVFLETLESLRLAERVGDWVLHEACRQLRAWDDNGVELNAWINLFPRQALDPNLARDIAAYTKSNGIAPDRIVVEVIESVVADTEAQLVESMRALRDLGVRTAIDDFGTGHSSLSRLREVPADIMKIDRSFINRSEEDAKARAVIHAVLQMAEELHFTPLAEGVENEAQLRLLQHQGCEYFQGFHVGRPMRASELERWIATAPPGQWSA